MRNALSFLTSIDWCAFQPQNSSFSATVCFLYFPSRGSAESSSSSTWSVSSYHCSAGGSSNHLQASPRRWYTSSSQATSSIHQGMSSCVRATCLCTASSVRGSWSWSSTSQCAWSGRENCTQSDWGSSRCLCCASPSLHRFASQPIVRLFDSDGRMETHPPRVHLSCDCMLSQNSCVLADYCPPPYRWGI